MLKLKLSPKLKQKSDHDISLTEITQPETQVRILGPAPRTARSVYDVAPPKCKSSAVHLMRAWSSVKTRVSISQTRCLSLSWKLTPGS